MGRPDVVRQATTDTVIRPMDTVVCGVAHGRARLLRDEDWFLPELRAFPMIRGDCAHGSPTTATSNLTIPHDSAVFVNAEHTRMCNTHHPGMRGYRGTNPPDPWTYHPQPQTYANVGCDGRSVVRSVYPTPDALTHHNLDAEPDRSRTGTRPNSNRNPTELEPEPDRFRHSSGSRGADKLRS